MIAGLAFGALLVACGTSPVGPSPSAPPRATTSAAPEGPPTPRPEQVLEWQRFRAAFGLRSDEAWIQTVVMDPGSANELDIPLLPWELDQVVARNLAVADLVWPLETYGRLHADSFAGAFSDGPVAVVAFTADVAARRAEVETILGDHAPVVVRQVRYSLVELDAFAARVTADSEALASAGVELISANPNVQENTVALVYRGDEGVEPSVFAHFGNPDWLTLTRTGARPWTGGVGRLIVTIVDGSGQPAEAGITLLSADSRVTHEFLPRDVTGIYDVDQIEAIAWHVIVRSRDRGGDEVATTITVQVPDGGTARARVVVGG